MFDDPERDICFRRLHTVYKRQRSNQKANQRLDRGVTDKKTRRLGMIRIRKQGRVLSYGYSLVANRKWNNSVPFPFQGTSGRTVRVTSSQTRVTAQICRTSAVTPKGGEEHADSQPGRMSCSPRKLKAIQILTSIVVGALQGISTLWLSISFLSLQNIDSLI